MEKQRVVEILREHETELKAAGLLHLKIFGSVARGDQTAESDVDLLFDYDESDSWNLFGAYASQERVTELLGVPAHLSASKHIRKEFAVNAQSESILVY